MKTQEEVISSVEPNMGKGKILFERTKIRHMSGEKFYAIEAAKKRKSKRDDEDDDYYNNDEEDDNPFDKEPDEEDLLEDNFPLNDDDELFVDEDDTYN